MDVDRICKLFQSSLDPELQKEAEQELDKIFKIIDFAPSILKVVTNDQVQHATRQAAAIYFKNMVTNYWEENFKTSEENLQFAIHENDKTFIRGVIVEAICRTPKLLRSQLSTAFQTICKADFPLKWPNLADQVLERLNSNSIEEFGAGLVVLYQLCKCYSYKKAEECEARNEVLKVAMPLLYARMVQILNDQTDSVVEIRKLMLKIFHSVTQYFYPLDTIPNEACQLWFVVCQNILEQELPPMVAQLDDDDERAACVWWKIKKWASRIMHRLFERFGSPGNTISSTYDKFAAWFLKTLAIPGMISCLATLEKKRQGQFIAPRVLQHTLQYTTICVNHSVCWLKLKAQLSMLVQEVIFPLLCFSKEDEELWNDDPLEYIRTKFDIFEEFYSPVNAAETLLILACTKRKEVLPQTLQFAVGVLTHSPPVEPQKREGALRLIGCLADVLLKKKMYKVQVENMLITQVIPQFGSDLGFMRARACWVVNQFASVKMKEAETLVNVTQGIVNCILSEQEQLPVKVNAAVALHSVIGYQERSHAIIKPVVAKILEVVLKLIRETVNDDLNGVIQRLISTFEDDIAQYAVNIAHHLAETFKVVLERDDDENVEDRAMTAMGLLNTIESMVNVLEDNKPIMQQLEPIVLSIVGYVLQNNSQEFYEEILSLVDSLTVSAISPSMWQLFDYLFSMFSQEGYDYFLDFLPPFHNYITVDTPAFESDPSRIEKIFVVCRQVLTNEEANEDFEMHAAKLLEVLIIQCSNETIAASIPHFLQLVFDRLSKEIKCSELRTMCIQVVIAALYKNADLVLQILNNTKMPNSDQSITHSFITQWMSDLDCFFGLHDRKLCVLGLCTLLEQHCSGKVDVINGAMKELIPSFLLLFSGLRRAYQYKAAEENECDEDEDKSDDENEELEEEVDDDEDAAGDDEAEYLLNLTRRAGGEVATLEDESDDDDDEDSDLCDEETNLESYTTSLDDEDCEIDEFVIFKNTITAIRDSNPVLFETLTNHLTSAQKKEIDEIFVSADQRHAAKEAKKIEKAGGYQFQQTTVPQMFNFSPQSGRPGGTGSAGGFQFGGSKGDSS